MNAQKVWLPLPGSCMSELTRFVSASLGPTWLNKLLVFDELNCSKTWRFHILLSRAICILTGYAWTLGLTQRNKFLVLEFPVRQVGEADTLFRPMFQGQPSNPVIGPSTFLCLPFPSLLLLPCPFLLPPPITLFLQVLLFEGLSRPQSHQLYSILLNSYRKVFMVSLPLELYWKTDFVIELIKGNSWDWMFWDLDLVLLNHHHLCTLVSWECSWSLLLPGRRSITISAAIYKKVTSTIYGSVSLCLEGKGLGWTWNLWRPKLKGPHQ